jgi:hypothetical protein
MRQNKTFYTNALNTTGQNSFPEYLNTYIRDIAISAIENSMPPERYDRDKWEFFVSFFSTAFVAFLIRWANEGMKEDPAEFIEKIRSFFDGSVLHELADQIRKSSGNEPTKKEKD